METINRNIMKHLRNDHLRNVINDDKVVKKWMAAWLFSKYTLLNII